LLVDFVTFNFDLNKLKITQKNYFTHLLLPLLTKI